MPRNRERLFRDHWEKKGSLKPRIGKKRKKKNNWQKRGGGGLKFWGVEDEGGSKGLAEQWLWRKKREISIGLRTEYKEGKGERCFGA